MNKDEECIPSTQTNPGSQPRNIEGNPKTKGKMQSYLSKLRCAHSKVRGFEDVGVNFCFLGVVKVHSIEYKRSIGEEAQFLGKYTGEQDCECSAFDSVIYFPQKDGTRL